MYTCIDQLTTNNVYHQAWHLILFDLSVLVTLQSVFIFTDVSEKPRLKKKFDDALQAKKNALCGLCEEPLTVHSLITKCGHIYCKKCIRISLARVSECPNCSNALLGTTDLFSYVVQPLRKAESSMVLDSSDTNKVELLLKLLKEQKSKTPTAKSVVFSQFKTMLSLLEKTLLEAGFIPLCLFDMNGRDMTVASAIEKFNKATLMEDKPVVLLVSIQAETENRREKFDLKTASNVYLMEACKKRAEKWAVKCIHRTEKKEPVKVLRIIAKNTIEDKILELHEKRIEPSVNPELTCCADAIDVNEMSFLFNG